MMLMQNHLRDLQTALVTAHERVGPDIIGDLDLQDCDWETVIQTRDFVVDAIDAAKGAYKDRGTSNPLRRIARQSGTIVTTIEPLLAVIPDKEGLSALKGGLALIFKVCLYLKPFERPLPFVMIATQLTGLDNTKTRGKPG
jgi:hypothetical protein